MTQGYNRELCRLRGNDGGGWVRGGCGVVEDLNVSGMLWITRPQVYRVVREMLPRERFGPAELLWWLEDTQEQFQREWVGTSSARGGLRSLCAEGKPERHKCRH